MEINHHALGYWCEVRCDPTSNVQAQALWNIQNQPSFLLPTFKLKLTTGRKEVIHERTWFEKKKKNKSGVAAVLSSVIYVRDYSLVKG